MIENGEPLLSHHNGRRILHAEEPVYTSGPCKVLMAGGKWLVPRNERPKVTFLPRAGADAPAKGRMSPSERAPHFREVA